VTALAALPGPAAAAAAELLDWSANPALPAGDAENGGCEEAKSARLKLKKAAGSDGFASGWDWGPLSSMKLCVGKLPSDCRFTPLKLEPGNPASSECAAEDHAATSRIPSTSRNPIRSMSNDSAFSNASCTSVTGASSETTQFPGVPTSGAIRHSQT
jgi:hypothetical protein